MVPEKFSDNYLPFIFGNGLFPSTCLSESGATSSPRKSEDTTAHGKLTFEEINILPLGRRDGDVDDVDVRPEDVYTTGINLHPFVL